MLHNCVIKSVQYGRERWTSLDDEGAKAVIEPWFEFIGGHFSNFLRESSQPAAGEMDGGESECASGIGNRDCLAGAAQIRSGFDFQFRRIAPR